MLMEITPRRRPGGAAGLVPRGPGGHNGGMPQAWSDEFDGPLDLGVWTPETGGGGWGDDQLQVYAAANASVTADGRLALVARRENGTITSARLITKDRVHVRYGRVEARIKVPPGPGVWPAFWLLGADLDRVGWPACGEIDVMEYVGSRPTTVHGTLHGPGYAGLGAGIGTAYDLGRDLSAGFHVYGVQWAPDEIRWHVDGVEYQRLTPGDVPGPWPFRHPFYLLINLAVGGRWPGNDARGIRLPATVLVDWVRIHDAEI